MAYVTTKNPRLDQLDLDKAVGTLHAVAQRHSPTQRARLMQELVADINSQVKTPITSFI